MNRCLGAKISGQGNQLNECVCHLQICLSGGLQTDECTANTHDCWRDGSNSACVDTFRGYVCECPVGEPLLFQLLMLFSFIKLE